jgi:hypothetical protein
MPTLADIYSAIDSAKRKGSDFVRNPGASLQQMLGNANDRARALNELTYQAAEEGVGYGPKTQQLAKQMAESYNPVGMFIGPNAASFNKIMATKALELEKAGKSAEEIWEKTGTFRGPDKQWRQEISDKNLQIQDYRNTGGAIVIKHPELQASYEQLPRGIKVKPSSQMEGMAAYEAPKRDFDWKMGEGGTIHVPSSQVMPKDIYAHELQHAVQAKEGFASGGSPSSMVLILEKLAKQKREEAQNQFRLSSANDPLDPLRIVKPGARQKGLQLEKEAREIEDKALAAYRSEQTKFDLYQKLAGEAEARATEKRLNLSDEERRKLFPYKSYDVPIKDLILRYK